MSKAEKEEAKAAEEQGGSTHTDGAPNGNGNGGSIADRAEEEAKKLEAALPEPAPLGDKRGTIPLPVGATPTAKRNVEVVVEMTKHHTPGAGQLDINKEHLLLVRAEFLEGVPRPKRDGDKRVIGFKYIQKLKPNWMESLEDWLDKNGLKIVHKDEAGKALDQESLVDIEAMRQEGALD
jgi:hypothetical protein